ncbi:hypothetical protein DW322_17070 [Rhodococcus rhodnii]|uniref:HTH cro/C1-type domain-containing protein n=1 Tax=Rhodococcus rhodnii TaxID=38312 RepID=A0A6P2CFR0_9NOCA|nr:hypothetical protein DW322_17070 [Rhodococcus rhodnii]
MGTNPYRTYDFGMDDQHDASDAQRFCDLFAGEVRAEMARRRISGRELARRLDENPQWAAMRVNGSIALDTRDIARFATAIGMSPSELLRRVAEEAERGAPALD